MKRIFLWAGIIALIIGVILCVFISKIQPIEQNEDVLLETLKTEETEASTFETDVSTQGTTMPSTEDKCEHERVKTQVTQQAIDCLVTEIEQIICIDCDFLIKENVQEQFGHDLITKNKEATCNSDGEIYEICSVCDYKNTIQVLTKLSHITKEVVITERSCTSNGEIQTICERCNTVLDTRYPLKYNHQWISVPDVFPTPVSDGTMIAKCYHCQIQKTETVKFEQNGDVNLCIPSIKLNKEVVLAECNQSNTDKYDISCDMNFINNNNPLFFGHNTRSLGELYNIKIGDCIYFTINGETVTYRVIVSEEGTLINGGVNIQGNTTGELCISNKTENTLHFFTCYQTIYNPNGRWIVLAEKV